MNKLQRIYSAFIGKHILSYDVNQYYNEEVLSGFLKSKEKYLLYDTNSNKVFLLNENEMRVHYKNGNYRDYERLVDSFDDFCLNCCIEVLKEFSNYSIEEIEKEFEKHDILKYYVL